MPGAKEAVTIKVTTMGWLDPLDICYQAIVQDLQEVCQGHGSMGGYGKALRRLHHRILGSHYMAKDFLHLEEHAFYILCYKFAATAALHRPQSLSTDDKTLVMDALSFAPDTLKGLTQQFLDAERDNQVLSTMDEKLFHEIVRYIYACCNAQGPLTHDLAPRAAVTAGCSPLVSKP